MMATRFEAEVKAALTQAAQGVRVPGVTMPMSDAGGRPDAATARRQLLPVLVVCVAVMGVVAVTAWALSTMRGPDDGSIPTPATRQASSGPASTAPLPVEPPSIALARGSSIIAKRGAVDLGAPIVAIDSISDVSVARTSDGTIWRYSVAKGKASPIGRDGSAGPVLSVDGGSALWVESSAAGAVVVVDSLDVLPGRAAWRIALPRGASCCSVETVLGMDQHRYLYLGTPTGVWVAYLGEGHVPDPGWTSVSGLGDSLLAEVAVDEVIVRQAQGGMAWGRVEPTTADYIETAAVGYTDLRFVPDGVVAETAAGRLVAVAATIAMDVDSNGVTRPTHRLQDPKFELELPGGAELNGVAHEQGRHFLVDLDLDGDRRAWYRCTLSSPECELAAELEPDDVTPR